MYNLINIVVTDIRKETDNMEVVGELVKKNFTSEKTGEIIEFYRLEIETVEGLVEIKVDKKIAQLLLMSKKIEELS